MACRANIRAVQATNTSLLTSCATEFAVRGRRLEWVHCRQADTGKMERPTSNSGVGGYTDMHYAGADLHRYITIYIVI